MADKTNITEVKEAARQLGSHVDFVLSPTAFYFADTSPAVCVMPRLDKWTCMFALMGQVQTDKPAVFTAERPGCIGAGHYLGFNGLPTVAAAFYLANMERLKKDAALAAAFYHEVKPIRTEKSNLVLCRLDTVQDDAQVEVVNLWVDVKSLSSLHALANYDRATNDNVIMPFSSGCQSVWTLPYKEKDREKPKAVAGSLDPTVRSFLPADVISFSAPANRFLEMCSNIEGSFMAL